MLYSYIVKKKIAHTFDHVNNHQWNKAVEAVAQNVHHRVSGNHALAVIKEAIAEQIVS